MLPISGSLYYVDASFDRDRIVRELDAQQAAGFDLIWINGPALSLGWLSKEGSYDPVASILEEAASRNMRVILEVMAREDWHFHWDLESDLNTSFHIIEHINRKYGGHRSFYGYYLGNEIYVVQGKELDYCLGLWKQVCRWCRELTPGCKVVLSPFFVTDREEVLGYPYAETDEYETFWNGIFGEVDIDALLLQDSGAEHSAFLSLAEREPYFAAVGRACAAHGVELWGNVELAEIDVADFDEMKQFRGEDGVNGPGFQDARWIQVPVAKLQAKMELASRYANVLVSWGYQQFVSPCSGKAGAKSYEEAFRKLNKTASGSLPGL
ncbi:DUF4434 domain-containing protein [Paenibacillus agaridevorans]|uniref:DUF4434 domain-containing protein n=1 Tax=Paenibacillus agaridevorans TaxID=171404 RepID=UPI001BE499FC|nr:DUF4434 domain-containing protein [Paenibacillus agaridevorans]